jgi:small ligand-binding sensory domain FIST
MHWSQGSSRQPDAAAAARETASQIRAALGQQPIDLVVAFFSAPHVAHAAALRESLQGLLQPGTLIGVSACGVITTDEEIERGPALSVIAGRLPGVQLCPFVVGTDDWKESEAHPGVFAQMAPGCADAEFVLLFTDPLTTDTETILAAFHRNAPEVRVAGGMASAAGRLGGNAFFLNDWEANSGGVGLGLRGALRADVVVSQGCRSVGPPLEVTHAEKNLIHTLDGTPALQRIEQVLRELSVRDRDHVGQGIFVGRPTRRDALEQGDYLIRNLVGADPHHGILALGDPVENSERIRLHVRDAVTSREDLELLLSPQTVGTRPEAAFLFSCNGRGHRLFGTANGDVLTLQDALGGTVPLAGMFCAGEIGPVGGRSYVHGHTACAVIIRSR